MYVALLVLTLQMATPADEAPAADPEARRLYQKGQVHYDRGELDQAVAMFLESYYSSGAPRILYNIGQALRLKGDCSGAAERYRQFIERCPLSPHRGAAAARLAEMEACAARQTVAMTVPAQPTVAAPTPVLDLAGDPRQQQGRRGARRWAPFILGSAVVTGGAAAFFGWRARQASARTSRLYESGGLWDEAAMDNERQGKASQRAALWLGAAALVTGGVATWLLLDDELSSAEPPSGPRVSLAPGLALGGWYARF